MRITFCNHPPTILLGYNIVIYYWKKIVLIKRFLLRDFELKEYTPRTKLIMALCRRWSNVINNSYYPLHTSYSRLYNVTTLQHDQNDIFVWTVKLLISVNIYFSLSFHSIRDIYLSVFLLLYYYHSDSTQWKFKNKIKI